MKTFSSFQNSCLSDEQPLITHEVHPSASYTDSLCCDNSPDCRHRSFPRLLISDGAPPGLQFLSILDRVMVKQKIQVFEVLKGVETQNNFSVMSPNSEEILTATESTSSISDSDFCPSTIQPLDLLLRDTHGHDVLMFSRRLSCDSFCFPFGLMRMEVVFLPSTVFGYIVQEWSVFHPKFRIEDPDGEVVMRIEGPFWKTSCGAPIDYPILTADSISLIGKISKTWHETAEGKQANDVTAVPFTDNFEIVFPPESDFRFKSMILAACFLIHSMYHKA